MALLTVVPDEAALAERAAERFTALAGEGIRARGGAMLCLTGGTTPKRMYELLATPSWQARLVWEAVHLYWSDERHVPPDHQDSNYRMAWEALVMHVPVPMSQVHRMRGELDPDEAARLYDRELPDRFTLMLLGVGEDAHIGSLFPGSPLLAERHRRTAAIWVPHLEAFRMTLTPAALLDADRILVIVSGRGKAAAVAAAFDAPTDVARYPVHLLRDAGERVEWIIDRAAARDVSERHA